MSLRMFAVPLAVVFNSYLATDLYLAAKFALLTSELQWLK